jgi:zinc transport system permease protein
MRRKRKARAMLDDFFTRALLAGIGIALIAGPLGCFVVWRRMAYFGDTMAHSALLGVAMSLLFSVNIMVGVFGVAALVALALMALERRRTLPSDALLGILSHSALAVGLVAVSFMTWLRFDLNGLLFGDILSVTAADLSIIYGGGMLILVALVRLWSPLLADTVNHEIAEAEGMKPQRARIAFMFLVASVIAIAMKIVGIMLITALLIIPAAAARRFAKTPEMMALMAAAAGCLAVAGGLFGSLKFDTPSGPSIVVAALGLFLLSLLPFGERKAIAGEAHHG